MLNQKEKEQIQNLLAELELIKSPEGLTGWNMKAQALLTFIVCKNPLDINVPVKEMRVGQIPLFSK